MAGAVFSSAAIARWICRASTQPIGLAIAGCLASSAVAGWLIPGALHRARRIRRERRRDE